MESSPPFPIEPGERVLAAIVFTDVVNFSARVQAEEVSTLSLLEQDFAVMTKYCEKYSGWVLKSTGDGLLLYFSSAVHAVNCALQIQHFFSKRTQNNPLEKPLTHRIGIHLGDIFLKDHDVMGDGVNIASRLQSVADPGGICISQTVYDVVKNKLELEVDRMTPRELKNITDVGTMYRVLLEARKTVSEPAEFRPPDRSGQRVFSRTEKLVGAGLAAVALAIVVRLMLEAHSSQQAALADSQATQAALDAILKEKRAGAAEKPVVVSTPGKSADAVVAPTPERTDDYNFAEMATNPGAGKARTEEQSALIRQKANERVQVLIAWVKASMERYTQNSPMLVPRLNASMPAELKVFTDSDHRFVFATGGAARSRTWDELKQADQQALIVGTLLNSMSAPPPDVLLGADAFAYLHNLPELVAAVHPRPR